MNSFFSTIETGFKSVKGAFSTIVDVLQTPYQKAVEAGREVGGSIYPAPQKSTIVSSTVSNQPTFNFLGYRPTIKGATTLSNTYQAWWKEREAQVAKWINDVKGTYMGYKVNELTKGAINTLGTSLDVAFKKTFTSFADILSQKLGIETRSYTGETARDEETQVLNPVYDTQLPFDVRRPPTTEVVRGFWEELSPAGSQDGLYNIAYDPATPPKTSPVAAATPGVPAAGGFPVLPFLLVGVGIWLVARKRK